MTLLNGAERDEAGRSEADNPMVDQMAVLARPQECLQPDTRPTLLVIGDPGRADAIALWAERAGLRCLGRVAPEVAAARLGSTIALDLVLVDLRDLDVAARIGRATAVALAHRHGLPGTRLAVITDLAGLDCALALLESPDTDFLCEPAESDVITLLVMAGLRETRSSRMPLHDAARDGDAARFERLSEEVRRLAATIERMTHGGAMPPARNEPGAGGVMDRRDGYRAGGADAPSDPARQFQPRERSRPASADGSVAPTYAEVRAIIRARRMRDQHLPADLFADPAWDMMLDLLAARLSGQRVSVSSLCIAAAVPPTTALRWIRQLTDRAVFARIDDPADGRRVFIELTEAASQAVLAWTQAVRRNGGILAPRR